MSQHWLSILTGWVFRAARDGLQGNMVDCLLNIDVDIKWQDIADQQAGMASVLSCDKLIARAHAMQVCSVRNLHREMCMCSLGAGMKAEVSSCLQAAF